MAKAKSAFPTVRLLTVLGLSIPLPEAIRALDVSFKVY